MKSLPIHAVAILFSVITFSTQTAVEYLCDPERVAELVRELDGDGAGGIVPFEAMLRCKIRGGAPVSAELVFAKK